MWLFVYVNILFIYNNLLHLSWDSFNLWYLLYYQQCWVLTTNQCYNFVYIIAIHYSLALYKLNKKQERVYHARIHIFFPEGWGCWGGGPRDIWIFKFSGGGVRGIFSVILLCEFWIWEFRNLNFRKLNFPGGGGSGPTDPL